MREETGAAICESLLSVRPPVVLDPTMLLTAEEWRDAVARGASAAEGPHVAAYWVRTVSQSDVDALAAFSHRRGVPVRLMSAGPLPKLDFPNEVVPFVDADPFAFVREIADSDSVATDSFHGLQFAAIFRRPFAALGDVSDPKSNASRLVDFCRRYGLGGRVQDIGGFRNGEAPHVDVGELDAQALEADRIRSIGELRALVQC